MVRLAHKVTYDDYAGFLPDGRIHEVIDGELFVTPAPDPFHQRASKRLQRQLEGWFEATGRGEVFNAPIDVIFTKHDVVQPDLVVVTEPSQISGRGIEGPPFLLVEVLSPSTAKTDRTVKLARYLELGVPHYWIVDPDAHALECYRASSGHYDQVACAVSPARLRHPDFPELEIDVSLLWDDPASSLEPPA